MYKDVRKKLLSVALCICMVMGMVQVVPKVKAATVSRGDITGQLRGESCTYTVTYEDPNQTFTYNGMSQLPKLELVTATTSGGAFSYNVTQYFRFRTDDSVNAGANKRVFLETDKSQTNVPCTLTESQVEMFTYEIGQAELVDGYFQCTGDVVSIKSGSTACPAIEVARLITKGGVSIGLTSDQYTVGAVSGTGYNVKASITVNSDIQNNFTAGSQDIFKGLTTTTCKAGYDLSDNDLYEICFINENDDRITEISYTGKAISVRLGIFNKSTYQFLAEIPTDSFTISQSQVTAPGSYEITVTPKDEVSKLGCVSSLDGGTYFTGRYTGTLKVIGQDPRRLKIYARNPDTGEPIDVSNETNDLILEYRNGDPVLPQITTIDDVDNNTKLKEGEHFTVSPGTNVSGVGSATIYIDFIEGASLYGGRRRTVHYRISSKLKIGEIGFSGYEPYIESANDFHLFYTGEPLLPSSVQVRDESDWPLTEDVRYSVLYGYKNGNDWVDLTKAEAEKSAEMAKSGLKRVLIQGKGLFQGRSVSKEYTIDPVKIADHKGWFKTKFTNNPPYSYNGTEQRPEVTVTYDNGHWGPADVTKYFTAEYANNISAGTATVILKAKPNSGFIGSLTESFSITPLSLSDAECIGDGINDDPSQYSYTGNAIKPTLKISGPDGDYILTEGKDYSITSYRNSLTNEPLSGAPVESGSYVMSISEGSNKINVQGTKEISYSIIPRDIAKTADFQLERGNSYEWEGGATEPKVICVSSVNLVEGSDYTVTYRNNTKPTDKAEAIIEGNGTTLSKDTVTLTFEITPRSIDNANITVTPAVSTSGGKYTVTLDVRDDGNGVDKKKLDNTDYTVAQIVYVTDNDYKGETFTADRLVDLPYAGEYELTLQGTGNYQNTRIVTVCCGTDITNGEVGVYYTQILTYNAQQQFPDINIRIDGTDFTLKGNSTPGEGNFIPIFTRGANDRTPSSLAAVNAGTVYVQVQGNPKKGYYGTTKQKGEYEIRQRNIADSLNPYQINFTDATMEGNTAYYAFTNETVTPQIVVSAAAITIGSLPEELNPIYDYTIQYGINGDDPRIQSGAHMVYINGTGNFTGRTSATFYIRKMGINDPSIVVTYENGDTSYAEEAPPTIVLTLSSGQRLVRGTDYSVNVTSEERDNAGWKNTYVYTVIGRKNFEGTTLVTEWKIPQTILQAPVTVSDPKSEDTVWNDTKLTVKPGAPAIDEREFKFSYIKKNGTPYNLKYGEDYTVAGFTGGTEPGPNTQLTIRGEKGFIGQLTATATLYANIGDAKLLKDATTGNYVGTLYDGAVVSTGMLEEAIKNGNLSDLIRFAPIWTSESGAWIDPSCYTVSLSCGDTPNIGSVVVTVAGNNEKYYAGSQSFTITVTGSLEGNVSRVVIGDNNAVKWNEQAITPDTVKVVVLDNNNNLLKGGYVSTEDVNNNKIPADYDYTVTFEDNTGVGLAKAIITGVNKYSGTLEQPFKITYPMNQLTIQIMNKENEWQDYQNGASYLYEIDTNKNQPKIRLLYPTGTNPPDAEVDERCYSITYSGYQTAGSAKAIIGEPESADYKGILLGTGRTVDYHLEQINLKDVAIEMERPEQMYTGQEKTAEDIGLKLTYNGYTLTDADYTVLFRDAINTDEVDGKKATVTIAGKGNFTGGATKEISILPLPLSNTEYINASAEQIIYTGKAEVPRITINQVKGNTRTLREGEDYTIVGYTDETKGASRDTPYTEIGTYYVKVEGLRNYASTTERYCYIRYEIVKREMDDGLEMTFVSSNDCPVINGEPQCVYNGKLHEPSVYVTFNGVELRGPSQTNPQYSLKYEDNRPAGTATVTITGNGSFDGEKTMTFTIAPKDITYEDIEYRDSQGNIFADEQEFKWQNNNTPVRPEIIVYDKSLQTQLVNGESMDYRIEYQDDSDNTQTNAGEVLMTIVGQNNYTGSKKFTYFIGEDISKSYVLVNGQRSYSTPYNGLVQAPQEEDISVVWNSDISDKDENGEKRYKIAYYYYGDEVVTGRFDLTHRVSRDQITEAGTYYVAVVGEPTKGTYAKSDASNSCMYTITPRNIGPSYILVSGYEGAYYYTGQAIEPKGLTVEDTDLPVSSAVNDPQRRSVKLINGKDYTVSYANNISAGKASIIVTGQGNYGGTRTAYFNILSSDTDGNNTWNGSSEGTGSISNGTTTISASDIILGYDNSTYDCMMYNGYERIPTISINGINANEFTVTASNNIRPGVATLTITGRGNNYTGTILKNFNIKADLSRYGRIASIEDQVYTGYQITPQVTLTCGGNLLNQGSDYTVTYMNNTGIGRATVTATATNDSYYIGSATGSFNISNTAGGMEITGYASSYTYTGYAITPDVAVTMNGRLLNRGTDYVVSYYNNVNVGTASMTVTGMGSFSGTKTINYTIEAKNIENCLTTTVTNYKYTGNTYTPSVTVTDSSTGKTLVAGTDYTIVYSNNTNPGTASITVTALSKNYTGSKVIPFKITSAAVSGLRVSSIKNSSLKLSWSSQDYADGYQICNSKNRVIATTSKNSYTVKGLNSCTTYKYKVRSYVENTDGSRSYGSFSTAVSAKTRLNTPKLKAVSTSKGKVTLTWTKVSKATGYEIYYSTKKNGLYTRLKTISKSSSRKYVDSGLASGEKYYYTIRAYRTTNGVKTYSSYNTIKAVRVK